MGTTLHDIATADVAAAYRLIAGIDAQSVHHDVAYRGRVLRWRRFGAGKPLVLLHGGHGSWLHWLRNVQALAARHEVWVPDMPGFHDSELPQVASVDALADGLIATLDTLVGRNTTVDLAGFSFGGLVAAQFAASRGAVRRIALLGTAGHGMPRRQTTDMQNWRLAGDEAGRRRALVHNLGALMLHGDLEGDPLALAIHEICCTRTRLRTKGMPRGGGLHAALGVLPQPLLLLWGEHDVTGDPGEVAEALAGGHPSREWCLVPGAGHWVQYERAEDINRMLLRWFAAEPPAG
jgi:pimeloyl-ACP methyl ester carboxylesterase